MVSRRGSATRGCLTWLLGLAILAYIGVHVGEPYYRFYRFKDAVNQQARFAKFRPDSAIRRDIMSDADSLDMPEGAYRLRVVRGEKSIRISGTYVDSWKLLSYTRSVLFTIIAEGRL